MTLPDVLDVEVTERDLFVGKKDCLTCPLALAMTRYFTNLGTNVKCEVYANEVYVHEDFEGYLKSKPWSVDYQPLSEARDFVIDFDEDRHVHPGVYRFTRSL